MHPLLMFDPDTGGSAFQNHPYKVPVRTKTRLLIKAESGFDGKDHRKYGKGHFLSLADDLRRSNDGNRSSQILGLYCGRFCKNAKDKLARNRDFENEPLATRVRQVPDPIFDGQAAYSKNKPLYQLVPS